MLRTMPTARFPPQMRFHHGRDYGRVMNRQQKAAGRWVVALVMQRRDQPKARLGVMVSVKVAKLAVRRHQLKRWTRELFRTELAPTLTGYDLVILLRRDPPVDGHVAFAEEIRRLIPLALGAKAEHRRRGKPP